MLLDYGAKSFIFRIRFYKPRLGKKLLYTSEFFPTKTGYPGNVAKLKTNIPPTGKI
jgi:hypothetical protein